MNKKFVAVLLICILVAGLIPISVLANNTDTNCSLEKGLSPTFEPVPTIEPSPTIFPIPSLSPHPAPEALGPDENGFWTSGVHDVELPSKENVEELLAQSYEIPWWLMYLCDPSIDEPYSIGELLPEVREISLSRLNMLRSMLGLYPLCLDDDFNNYAQHAALISKVNHILSHHPSKPSGFSQELFDICEYACARSNLAGPNHMPIKAIDAYMTDHQSIHNLETMGHRRNLMKPSLKYIGFGQVYDYNAIYVSDSSYGSQSYNWDTLAYPAANSYMPLDEYFFQSYTPWSITFNVSFFKQPNINDLTVRIEQDGNEIWSNAGELTLTSFTSPYMIINNESYGGGSPCLIFRPDVENYSSGEYIVYIDGLYNKNNELVDFKYKVTFFIPGEELEDPEPQMCPINYLLGDTDYDNEITLVDAMLAMRYSMGLIGEEELPCPNSMDIDMDGTITVVDVIMILRLAMIN